MNEAVSGQKICFVSLNIQKNWYRDQLIGNECQFSALKLPKSASYASSDFFGK